MTDRRVLNAITQAAGAGAQMLAWRQVPWASPTFSGAQHTFRLCWTGNGAQVEAGEAFLSNVPDAELRIPGLLVADIHIASFEHTMLPTSQLLAEINVLVLNDA